MQDIWLIQAGGHSKQCIDIFLDNNYNIKGIFDDYKEGLFYRNINIIDKITNINEYLHDGDYIFCCVGDNYRRKEIVEYINKNKKCIWVNCISKLAYISNSVKLGYGIYIGSYSKILSDTIINNFSILNDGSTITHDNYIDEYTHVASNVSLGGNVTIGKNCLIGMNSVVNPKIVISNNITIGSGSVVTKSIYNSGIYKGVPCK